jgi:hypothetical protein
MPFVPDNLDKKQKYESSSLESSALGFSQGALGGVAKQIGAGLGAAGEAALTDATFGDAYNRRGEMFRMREKAAEEQYPVNYYGGMVVGGLPLAMATMGGSTAPLLSAGQRIKAAGQAAAPWGALAGYGASDGGMLDQLTGVATGAVGAGLLGGALQSLPEAGIAAYRRFAPNNIDRASTRNITKSLLSGGKQADELSAAARDYGALGKNEAVLADIGGAKMQDQITALGQSPDRSFGIMENVMKPRTRTQLDRVSRDIDEAFAGKGNVFQNLDLMKAERAAKAKPLYESAYLAPTDFGTPDIQGLLARVPEEAFSQAQKMANVRGYGQKVSATAAQPNAAINTEGMDYILRGLGDVKSSAYSSGSSGYATELKGLQNDLQNLVYAKNPLLREARKQYAGDTAAMEMVEEGRGLFAKSPQYVENYMQGVGAGNEVFPQEGLRSSLLDRLSSISDTANTARPLSEVAAKRDILTSVLRSPEKSNRLISQLDAETSMFGTATALERGKNTGLGVGRLAAVEGTPISNLSASRGNMLTRGIDAALSNPQRVASINEATASKLMTPINDVDPLIAAYGDDVAALMRQSLMARLLGTGAGISTGSAPQDFYRVK